MVRFVKDIYLTFLFNKAPIDPDAFFEDWETKYGGKHDPSPQEVLARLEFLAPKTVLEFGAGYGRIATQVQNVLTTFCYEPNAVLAERARQNGIDVESDLRQVLASKYDIIYTVRVMEYISVIRMIKVLRQLSRTSNLLISWENNLGARRLRISRLFAPAIQVVIIELVN